MACTAAMVARLLVGLLACLCDFSVAAVRQRDPLTGYDPAEAKKFASLASAAYCDAEPVMHWTCGACRDSQTPLVPGKIRVIDGGGFNATRIIVGKLRDQDGCLMSFRGSENTWNWIRDFEAWEIKPTAFKDCEGCMVHSGFYANWENVRDLALKALQAVGCTPMKNDKNNLLYVTGHSLGAALTHLAMFTLDKAGYKIANTYSFEAPRVGNRAFSDEFSARFARKFPVFRITHSKDPVPHLPPKLLGYTHVQTEVYYAANGTYKTCTSVEDKTCADQYWDLVDLLLHTDDHCNSPLVPNGNICNCQNNVEVIV